MIFWSKFVQKVYFPSKKEIALAFIFVFYYIKRFLTRIDKDNGILMSALLLVAVTAILFMKNSLVFKADIPPTMLSPNYLIKFSTLLRKRKFTLVVFVDLSKAVDTVDHSILLKKNVTLWHNWQKSCMVWKLLV